MSRASMQVQSPGLALLVASRGAFPSSMGDRAGISAINSILDLAISNRVKFDINDGQSIVDAHLEARTCVGIFRPLDQHWYEKAAIAGGSFARMWEKHFGCKPFIAPMAWRGGNLGPPLKKQRMAPGLAILLPESEPERGLQAFFGSAVWWCTSLDFEKDRVNLCRYKTGTSNSIRHPSEIHDPDAGIPVRRMRLDRSAWGELVKTMIVNISPEDASSC